MQCLLWRACTSLSLSICKHGLGPDQTRMVFRIECFVNLKMCACDRKYANIILWNVGLCRTKADAHDEFGFWVLIGSSCNKIDWLTQTLCFLYSKKPSQNKRFVCKHHAVSFSPSLSLSTFTTCYQSLHTICRPTCLIRGKQAYLEL